MQLNQLKQLYEKHGVQFILPIDLLSEKLKRTKALIFDWDGVFHSGYKSENKSSLFSEADSMGVNMLRFSHYLLQGKIPYTAIITGENNPTAFHWAKREHLNDVFYNIKDKAQILRFLEQNKGISPKEVLFIFDDILDLSMAKECGTRIMINRSSSLMLQKHCIKNNLCDVITANDGGNHAVREWCELNIALLENWDMVINERMKFNQLYTPYIQQRQKITTGSYTIEQENITYKGII